MNKQKVHADEIKYALSKRNYEELFLTEVKTGPSTMSETLRFDAFSIKKSWTKPCFTGYEVKVSRNDFLHDDKYIHYRDYCNRLYIVCPKDLIQLEEIPEDIGLIYYNPDKKTLFTKRVARLREIEMPGSLLYYILLSRISDDQHPFFSSKREYIESYIEDKAERSQLAYKFNNKLTKQVQEANDKVQDAELKLQNYQRKADERDAIVKLMQEKGFLSWDYNVIDELKKAFERQYPQEFCRAVSEIDNDMRKIKSIIWPESDKQQA